MLHAWYYERLGAQEGQNLYRTHEVRPQTRQRHTKSRPSLSLVTAKTASLPAPDQRVHVQALVRPRQRARAREAAPAPAGPRAPARHDGVAPALGAPRARDRLVVAP